MIQTKKIISILMAGMLSISLLAGCSGKEKDSAGQSENGGKGRYVEQEIELPDLNEKAVGLFQQDKGLHLYMVNSKDGAYFSYTWDGSSWSEKTPAEWLNDAYRQGIGVEKVLLGQDGQLYAMGTPTAQDAVYGSHILKCAEDGNTSADITPEELLKVGETGFSSITVDFDVLPDGALAVATMSDQPKVYREGKEVFQTEGTEIVSNLQNVLVAVGDSLAVIGADGKSVQIFGGSDFKEQGKVVFEDALYGAQVAGNADGKWFVLDNKGIHRFLADGSVVETIMEGSGGLMSMETVMPAVFTPGDDDDFYALYSDSSSGTDKLEYYRFDPNVKAVADSTLKVYGLKESATVSQAIYEFQRSHPEIKVEYTTAGSADTEITTDMIKSLNTELLSGNGADVLILDGLPIQSYIEKGVLADLSDLVKQLGESGVLTDVIGNTAEKDGKVYALPARIGIPVMHGPEEGMRALDSLEALQSYMDSHPDSALLGKATHDSMGKVLINIMYNELQDHDGSFDEEKLTGLLNNWMKLCDAAGSKKLEEEWGIESMTGIAPGMTFSGNTMIPNASALVVTEFIGLGSMMMPFAEMNKYQHSYSTVKDIYVPYSIAGMNASSSQKDAAEEFIRTLFTDAVQNTKTEDGYPVTENGLSETEAYVDSDAAAMMSGMSSWTDPDTGETIELEANYPSREQIKTFNEAIKGLKTPFVQDQVAIDTILGEMDHLYNGSVDASGAAKAIIQKINTYLAE